MRTASKWAVAFLAAAGLGIWVTPASHGEATTQPSSDTQTATGNISGVVMKDGKPLANARVGLIDRAQVRDRLATRAKGQDSGNQASVNADQKRQRPTPTATTMTDADGKFAITDVKVGEYLVIAMAKGEGRGRTRASVAAGETANVEIQVNQGAKGAGKAGKLGGNQTDKTGNTDNTGNAN